MNASFGKQHPALLLSLAYLLGTASVISRDFSYLVGFLLFLLPFWKTKYCLKILFSFLIAACLSSYLVSYPSFPKEKFSGKAVFEIDTLKLNESPFQKSYLYQGTLKSFEGKSYTISNLPCQIFHPLKQERYAANTLYEIQGSLEQKSPHSFVFKPEKKVAWKPLKHQFSLAELRFNAKRRLEKHLISKIQDPKTAHFLLALATGDVDERILSTELGKVGLQHLLAVSGFHFGVLTAFLSLFFSLIFPKKAVIYSLLLALTGYFIFLGNSPSVERAWISLCLPLAGRLFGLRISGLNALGVSLLVALIKKPLIIQHMGFQMSFLCTLALLLAYHPIEKLLGTFLKTRSLKEVLQMNTLNCYGYIAVSLLRRSLALNLAVHLMTIIPLLLLFHRFPLMSFAYNLFFPLWVSLSMVLLCLGLMTSWIPALSHLFHALNQYWTGFALEISASPPAFLDFVIRTDQITILGVVVSLILSFQGLIRIGKHA